MNYDVHALNTTQTIVTWSFDFNHLGMDWISWAKRQPETGELKRPASGRSMPKCANSSQRCSTLFVRGWGGGSWEIPADFNMFCSCSFHLSPVQQMLHLALISHCRYPVFGMLLCWILCGYGIRFLDPSTDDSATSKVIWVSSTCHSCAS